MFTGTRSRLLLIGLVLAALGAVALSWFFGVSPQLQAMERAKNDTSQERAINDLEQIAVGALRAQNENIDQLHAELDAYRLGIPDAHRQPELLRLINSAAERSGVALTGLQSGEILSYLPPDWQQPAPAIGQDRLVGLSLEITAEGESGKLRDFVANVQQLQRYITIGSVSYTTDDSGLTKVTVKGTAWVLLASDAVIVDVPAETPATEASTEEGEVSAS